MSENVTGTFAEAPASFNVRLVSPDGYDCQLTLRGVSGADLLPKIGQALEWAKGHGYTPGRCNGHTNGNGQASPKGEAPADVLTDDSGKRYKVCQAHDARMYEHVGKSGQAWYSHKLASGEWCKGK